MYQVYTSRSGLNKCVLQVALDLHLQQLLQFQPVKKLLQLPQQLLLLASVEQRQQQQLHQVMQQQLQPQQQLATQLLLQLRPQQLVPTQLLQLLLLHLHLEGVDRVQAVQQQLVLQQLAPTLLQLRLLLPWLLLQVFHSRLAGTVCCQCQH